MSSFTFPVTFGSLAAGNQPLSDFDQNFTISGNMGTVGCLATGTNTVTLTSLAGYPTLTALSSLQRVGFVATNTTTGNTTLGYSGLGQFNAYANDGVTQIGIGDQLAGNYYEYVFNSALNSSAGGWQQIGFIVSSLSPTLTSITFNPTTSGIEGTPTNDNASSGIVGEYITSNILAGSAVPLTSLTSTNITSISLTAGDWDVWANVFTDPSGGASTSTLEISISTTSAVLSTPPANGGHSVWSSGGGGASGFSVSENCMQRLSLATTTTVYIVANSVFSGGSLSAYGSIQARRAR